MTCCIVGLIYNKLKWIHITHYIKCEERNNRMKSKSEKRKREETERMESENTKPSSSDSTALINSFIEITSSTKQEALFFLESHNFDLDAAVSSFLDNDTTIPLNDTATLPQNDTVSPSDSLSPDFHPDDSPPSQSPSQSPSRAPYELRSRRSIGKKSGSGSRQSGIRTLRDVKRDQDSDSESDDPQEYYAGGQKR